MNKLVSTYVLLLLLHTLHILEEIIGSARFIHTIYGGLSNFLFVNIVLLMIPLMLFYFVIKQNKISLCLAMLYSLIMLIDGLDHIITYLMSTPYIGGAAGIVTGILFIPTSILLFTTLLTILYEKKKKRRSKD